LFETSSYSIHCLRALLGPRGYEQYAGNLEHGRELAVQLAISKSNVGKQVMGRRLAVQRYSGFLNC
jgi:hypothetical protein